MGFEVEIRTIRDPPQFSPSKWELELDIRRRRAVVRELFFLMIAEAEILFTESDDIGEKSLTLHLPLRMELEVLAWSDMFWFTEILDLHLFEFTGSEDEIPRSDFVTESLSDLRDTKWYFLSSRSSNIREVDENPLSRLWAHIDGRC